MQIFKSNRIFGTKHSKINQSQKTIEYQTNEQSTIYVFELKSGNTKLLGNTNYNQVKLVLAEFASAFLFSVPS